MDPNGTAVSAPDQTPAAPDTQEIRLSTGVVSMGDARRLRRELAAMEDLLQAIRLRTNSPVAKMPRLNRSLEEFASTNRLNFLLPDDRQRAAEFMDGVLRHAPVMRVSFATEATRKFTTQFVLWLRANFHPDMLVEIGLEPNIAAGCVVRTTNKVFDFSLIKHLEAQQPMLMKQLLGEAEA